MGDASRWLRRAALLGLLLSLLTQTVRAEDLHILLVNADPQLSRAARAAFSSSAELHIAQDPRLGAIHEIDAQSDRARELARTEHADIIAWWTGSDLHTYDARTDRLLGTRRAPSLPVSSASAAALVLSIKALLQAELATAATNVQPANNAQTSPGDPQPIASDATSSESSRSVTPTAAAATGTDSLAEPSRRVTSSTANAAETGSPSAGTRTDSSVDAGSAVPPRAAGIARTDSSEEDPPPPAADSGQARERLPPTAATQPRFVVALRAGLASLEREPNALFGLGAAGWLDASPLGVALRVESGPQAKLHTSQIDARLLDASLAADFVLRAPTWLGLRIWGGIGPRLHLTRLNGTVGVSVDTKRIIPGVGGFVHIECDLTERWFIGAWASAGWLLITQRYYVDNMLVHESSRQRAAFGISLGIGFDRK